MASDSLAIILGAAIGTGGITGAIMQYRRAPADSTKLIAEAAQGAVLVQQAAITRLEKDLEQARTQLETYKQELIDARKLVDTLHIEIQGLRRQLDEMRPHD